MAEPRVFYKCNPAKNFACKKTYCYLNGGGCELTSDPDCTDDTEHITLVLPADEQLMEGVQGVRE